MGEPRAMRFFLVLFLGIVSANAEVLVYKGTARARLDAAKQFSKLPRFYYVVDVPAKIGYFIFYYKLNGSKQSTVFPPFDRNRYVGEVISVDSKIGTFTSVTDNDLGGGQFGATMLYLRGKETTLTLANNGVPTLGNFPKVLTGILRETQLIGTPTNFEFNLTLSFDTVRTQSANNGFKNGATTLTDITSELTALGY
jgi:hypothetical protein